jgi:hypothetical protein
VSRSFKPDFPDRPILIARLVRVLATLALSLFVSTSLAAQGDTTFTSWLRFRGVQPLELRTPAILRSPWDGGSRMSASWAVRAWDSAVSARLDSTHVARATALRLRRIYGRRVPGAEQVEDSTVQRGGLLGLNRRYADLVIDGYARTEIRTERRRNLRCTPAQVLDLNSGCRGGFQAPRLDTYLAVRSTGLLGRRVHVNVDYDSERDFTARNDIQLYYEGLEDEVVRRVEVGTVTFRPPPSRFLTASIPSNNFGVNATFEVGPVTLQGIAATQKGSVVAERTYTVGGTTVQPQDRQVRDLDYESGRFFWIVEPDSLPGFPSLDILQLDRTNLPPSAVINQGDVRVYRYRPAGTGINPNLGGIHAWALSADGLGVVAGQWELLRRDLDYYGDPSGLWIALTARLDQNDYLAVSYLSLAGQVGTRPAQDAGDQPIRDTLRLIVEPRVDASRSTFRHEMRQVYRVAGADLETASLRVELSLNRSERPLRPGAEPTYLAELGLATPADPNTFNLQDRLFPRTRDPNASASIKESYIVFPAIQPFADPARLTPAERNDSLYRTPGYLLFSEGPPARFLFRLRYNASSTADRSLLELGTLQIAEGTEALFLNGRRLEKGSDYSINYELGQVTFLSPQSLFGEGGASTILARFEERGIFAVAPTQVYGLSTRYSFGETGGINLMGVYQVEQSAFNRPQLGFEAQAHMVGGISSDLHFRPQAITRLLNSLTSTPAVAPSRLDLNAELALTRPDPNRSGQAYLEEFEGDPGVPISLRETRWEFGSRPQFANGVEAVVGAAFDTADAVQLTWQGLVVEQPTEIRARDIDDRIQIVGDQDQLETVLYLALHADTAGGHVRRNNTLRWVLPERPNAPRWRSMVTALSQTGVDLSRNEFLEFWAFHEHTHSADSAGILLMLDLGGVSEDAISIAPESLSTTIVAGDSIYTGRQLLGLDRLDTERGPTGVFNAATDDVGILADRPDALVVNDTPVEDPVLCRREVTPQVLLFPWGDLSARCSVGNGTLDTEDLDTDNQLNATGGTDNTFRWVVPLGAGGQYYVRTGVQDARGEWRLYRIPLRNAEHTLGAPNIRLVKHLRLTVIGPNQGGPDRKALFALARMRFLGAPWTRRSERPITGIAGATSGATGEVVASTVSTENLELGYESPPGVRGQRNEKGSGGTGNQINERSLRLIARGIDSAQRAEAYFRFASGAQNLLRYRQLRAWVRGRGPGWNLGGRDFVAYLRLGSDSRNFYQYTAGADTTTWEPELRIDLERWRTLRASIESRRLNGLSADSAARVACGGDPVSDAYVLCDGPYLAYIEDPAVNAPNLARVQELAAGILRVSRIAATDSAELWVDDIRLVDPISRVGSALALDVRLAASDVADLAIGYVREDADFQQIGRDPTYRTSGTLQVASGVRLERFLPRALGLAMPVSVNYTRSTVTPELLTGTDIRGSDLAGLRRPENWALNYSVSLRRVQRGGSWLVRGLIDPLSLTANFSRGKSVTELSQATSRNHVLTATYQLQQGRRGVTIDLGGLVGKLPGFLRRSDAADGLRRPYLNLVPQGIRLSSGITRAESDLLAFFVPVSRPSDAQLRPVSALSHLWRNGAGLTWQPLGMLLLSSDLASTRDLRQYSDSTVLGRVAGSARRQLLGLDVGVERDRQLVTSLQLTPKLVSWLKPRLTTGSTFVLSRSLQSRDPIREDGDTAGAFILPQTLNNTRFREYGAALDLPRVFSRALGDSSGLAKATRRIRPLDISDRLTRNSTFDLAAFDPSAGYQLALGGLDRFLLQHGDSAIGAMEVRNTTLSSGADLPLGVSFALAYSRVRSDRYQRSPGAFLLTQTYQREWPRGNVRLVRTLQRFPIATVGVGTSFRVVRGTTVPPSFGGVQARTATRSSTWSPDANLTLRNGMNLTFVYSMSRQSNAANGNVTRNEQNDITAGLRHAFPLPRSFGTTRRMVRSQLTALIAKGTTCLVRLGTAGCTGVSDVRRQEFRGTFDTDLGRALTGGLQFSYSLNDVRHLNQKSSQIIISASFQLSLFAGDYQ